jgi:cell division FtsZ-interacting protein ZapD
MRRGRYPLIYWETWVAGSLAILGVTRFYDLPSFYYWIWVFLQRPDSFGCRQYGQSDFAAMRFALYLFHDRQRTRCLYRSQAAGTGALMAEAQALSEKHGVEQCRQRDRVKAVARIAGRKGMQRKAS